MMDDTTGASWPFLIVMPNGNVYGFAGTDKYRDDFDPYSFKFSLRDAIENVGLVKDHAFDWQAWCDSDGHDYCLAMAREVRSEVWDQAEEYYREYPEHKDAIADLPCI